ncbi:MAG: heparinase II/III family protein, partial [Kiritimatiellae bacterium]|nr:heparinase II/III family protein [Kiritimatiellia bacterium]
MKIEYFVFAAFSVWSFACVAAVAPQNPVRVREIAAMLRPEPGFAETRIGNRVDWERIAKIDPKSTEKVIDYAARLAAKPIPVVDDTNYAKIYSWNRPHAERYQWLAPLTLAECLENKGRFLPRITELLETIAAMRTWVNPYHDRPDFKAFNGKWRKLELGNGQTVEALAYALDILRDRLPADVRKRVMAAIRAQVLDVYLDIARDGEAAKRHGCGWYGGLYNWNAACCSYFTTAAILLLDDPVARAEAIELAERSVLNYLDGFTQEGYCLEGASYWEYGFGRYLTLGINVRRATGGQNPFFPELRARTCFLSGYDVRYNDAGTPCFGDCSGKGLPIVPWTLGGMAWPDLTHQPMTRRNGVFGGGLPLTTFRHFKMPGISAELPDHSHVYPLRSWYEDCVQMLVCRPTEGKGLYASFKGGHNGAGHNHNDVGAFGIAIDGREIVGDPGLKKYDLDTFGPRRYESNLRNSYGHPVPYVDGKMQVTGVAAAAKLLRHAFTDEKDIVELDLRAAYDVPRLQTLTRAFSYSRAEGRVIVRDEVAFDGTGTFESPFVTFGSVEKVAEDTFKVTSAGGKDALICRVAATGGTLVTREEVLEDMGLGNGAPRRFAFAFKDPVHAATLEMTWERLPKAVPTSMVTHDGRRVVSRRVGTNVVQELVKDEGFAPTRPWRIYVVKATHTDIGLHNSQYIQRHGTVKRIEDAMRLIDADTRADDDPAAYRYVMEGVWFWENYPMDRGEAAAWNVISNYVRRGRIDIACGCAGNHTHLFCPEEIRRSALTKRRLLEKWGVTTRTMIMADNPGMSWSIVRPYAEAGMANIIFAPNQWNPFPSTLHKMNREIPSATWNPDARGGGNYIDVSYDSDRPMVFKWESYDRSTNLLVWCSTQYGHGLDRVGIRHSGAKMEVVEQKMPAFLAMLERKYPYDIWLACNYFDDEDANTKFADFAAKWNAKWKWPQFVTVGRLDEPFDELRRRFGDKIPVVRGEMTSGWLQHAVSVPEIQAQKFAAERLVFAAEKAWRADPSRDEAQKMEFDRAWWHLILNDEHSYGTSGYQGRRVFETWMQHRDWIERDEMMEEKAMGRFTEEVGDRVEVKEVGENAWYRVKVNEKGEILSIFDKELARELLDGPANRFLYTRDNHRTWSDEKLLGAKITRRVFLAKNEKRIDVENRFEHATDLFNTRRYYRHGYIAFPFAVPDGAFKAMIAGGEVIDPYRDQSGYATDAYVAVRDWCAVENDAFGVSLRQTDTFLTEFGEIHPDKTCFSGVPPKDKSAIYSYVFADFLQLHVPDGESISFTTRYSITSYDRKTPGGCTSRCGAEGVSAIRGGWPLGAADFADAKGGDWTGLIEAPRASHGEKDGQLYLLWGADMSAEFDHYELWRDDGFLANVTNEAPCGIPYRVARYVDFDAGSHTARTYRVRKVMKDGAKSEFSRPFVGKTRLMFETEAVESEGLRVEFNRNGGYVTSWRTLGDSGDVLFRPKCAPWGKEETHGGIPLCWPWFGTAEKEGLPKHGLLRYARWTLEEKLGKSGMVWSVASTPETKRLWPHDFRVVLTFRAGGDSLQLSFTCENTGTEPFDYTWGFHPYFAVSDAHRVAVDGVKKPEASVREVLNADGRPHVLEDLVTGRTVTISGKNNG